MLGAKHIAYVRHSTRSEGAEANFNFLMRDCVSGITEKTCEDDSLASCFCELNTLLQI